MLTKGFDDMKIAHHISALVFALALGSVTAFGQQTESITMNVKLEVSQLAPEVASILLHCEVRIGDTTVAGGSYQTQPVTNGAFNGTVAVPLKFNVGRSIQQAASSNGWYQCLMYLQDAANALWAPVASPAETGDRPPPESWSWVYPKPGTPFVPLIHGAFPPR